MTTITPGPAQRWADQLAARAIPDDIRAGAPEPSRGFDVAHFARVADSALHETTPSQQAAREVLPEGGSVLDVGCGAGAGSLPLVPPAGRLVGVDESEGMLEAFADRAATRGAAFDTVMGRWPDVVDQVPTVDVVVCHNVLYGVADLEPFVHALSDHARRRVVVQLTQEHPTAWLKPYWWHVHGIERPTGPTADDAIAAIRTAGYDVHVERWDRSMALDRSADDRIAFARRRLYLGPDRDPEIRGLLERYPPPTTRATATLWWTPPTEQ